MKTHTTCLLITLLLTALPLTFTATTQQRAQAGGDRRLVVQLGHSNGQDVLSVSPDAKLLASGGDRECILWELATGREIERMPLPGTGSVSALAFSPDAKTLAVTEGSRKISFPPTPGESPPSTYSVRLLDVATGAVVREIAAHAAAVTAVAFSPDGATLLTASEDKTANLWRVSDGRAVRTFAGHEAPIHAAVFSPDGKYVATGGGEIDYLGAQGEPSVRDPTARVWDVTTGREIRRFTQDEKDNTMYSGVGTVVFSPDGRFLLAAGQPPYNWGEVYSIRVWEIANGRQVRSFVGNGPVGISPDGKYLLADIVSGPAADWEESEGVELIDFRTGRVVRQVKNFIAGSEANAFAFTPDGKYFLLSLGVIVAGGSTIIETGENSLRMYETESGEEVRRFAGKAEGLIGLSVSADGKLILSGAYLWNVERGTQVELEGYNPAEISRAGPYHLPVRLMSRDGKLIALQLEAKATSREEVSTFGIQVWNTETGESVQKFLGPKLGAISSWLTPDGQHLLTEGGEACLWSLKTGKEVWCRGIDDGHFTNLTYKTRTHGHSFCDLSPDGKLTLIQEAENSLILVETQTGRLVWRMRLELNNFPGLYFSPDGRSFAVQTIENNDSYISFFDVQTRRVLRRVPNENGDLHRSRSGNLLDGVYVVKGGRHVEFDTGRVTSVKSPAAFPRGEKYFVDGDGLYDVASGKRLRSLKGRDALHSEVDFLKGDEFVVSGSPDGTTRIWKTATGEEACRLISFEDGTWVVVTPDGRFDTNNLDNIEGLHWVVGDSPLTPLPLEIFMRDYYEPRLLARTLSGEQLPPLPDLSQRDRAQPTVAIDSINAGAGDTVRLSVSVVGAKSRPGAPAPAVHDLRLFRNGSLVGYAPAGGGPLTLDAEGRATIDFEVRLPRTGRAEHVEFSAYAFNADRVKSQTVHRTFEAKVGGPAVKGRAYLLSVGVSDNENAEYRLSFAADDARAVEQTLGRQLRATGRFAEVLSVPLHADVKPAPAGIREGRPTKRAIEGVLSLLAGKRERLPADLLREIPNAERIERARPEDMVIIFFAGHGETAKGVFYLYPYDLGSERAAGGLLARAVSSDELSTWMRDIDAGEMLMVIDACHSAAAVEGRDFKPGPIGSRGLGQLSYDKGMRILTATQAADVAVEDTGLKHGLLTYALVRDGLLKFSADYRPTDGRINSVEWMRYAVGRVPEIYGEVWEGRKRLIVRGRQTTVEGARDYLERERTRTLWTQQPAMFDFARKKQPAVISVRGNAK